MDVEALVEQAAAEACDAPRRKALPWGADEDEFLRTYLGFLPETEIAEYLGRSLTAVRLRWKRDLGLPAPGKMPGYLTANKAGKALGKDVKLVILLVRRDLLPAHFLERQGGRSVCLIRELDLKKFVANPENHIYFRVEKVRDRRLRRLAELAAERWGDEWLTPGQVAELHGGRVRHQDVNRYVRAGKLPAVKWGNWWVRRSDAEQVVFRKGRGKGREGDWSDDGDAFLVLARAVGLTPRVIGRMMGWPKKVAAARLVALLQSGEVPVLAAKYGLEIEYDAERGRLLADWRRYRARFPALARAMERFAAGERLSAGQVGCVQGVLWAWAAYYLGAEHELVRRLQVGLGQASMGRRRSRLEELYLRLREEGIDPLSKGDANVIEQKSSLRPSF